MNAQEQEYIIMIEQFEKKEGNNYNGSKDSKATIESSTQTETVITTKACYFNSLANQLDDESYDDEEDEEEMSFSRSGRRDIALGRDKDAVQSQG